MVSYLHGQSAATGAAAGANTEAISTTGHDAGTKRDIVARVGRNRERTFDSDDALGLSRDAQEKETPQRWYHVCA
jgi:hypothetical protein